MPSANAQAEYRRVVDEAVNDLAEHGFDSAERLAYWEERIRRAAEAAMGPSAKMEEQLRELLTATYRKMIERGKIADFHPGIARWTIERVKPELRDELTKRIMASANLIRLKRKQRIEETIARFSGWATSLPKGGSAEPDKAEEKARVKKPIASLPFEERRVLTDQGHKLTSSFNAVVAKGGGAIAGVWRSHWRQPNYDYRPDHKDRDEKVYTLKDSWAIAQGLIRKGPNGHTDEITEPGEEPFCRCFYRYVYTLGQLQRIAPELITKKGEAALADARSKIAAMA